MRQFQWKYEQTEKLIRKEKEVVNIQQLIDSGVLEDPIKVIKVIMQLANKVDTYTRFSSAREVNYALATKEDDCLLMCDINIDIERVYLAIGCASLFDTRCQEQLDKERKEAWTLIKEVPVIPLKSIPKPNLSKLSTRHKANRANHYSNLTADNIRTGVKPKSTEPIIDQIAKDEPIIKNQQPAQTIKEEKPTYAAPIIEGGEDAPLYQIDDVTNSTSPFDQAAMAALNGIR
jgi:hypothetical protein